MNFEGKRILITGIRGFVGKHLERELEKRGAAVYGFVKNERETDRIFRGDMADEMSVKRVVERTEPDIIYHLAAQTFVPRSIKDPIETFDVNCRGTLNLLESVRNSKNDPIVVLAGSSEEYGLVIKSGKHYDELSKKYRIIPEPTRIPELPINENNPLRPVNPYGISKAYDELIMRSYHQLYGVKTLVTRNFNHEGPGRGSEFVTSVIVDQIKNVGKTRTLHIGNVNSLRDWSHIFDCIDGYLLLVDKGEYGDCYNLGSMRTNSVLTFILLSLKVSGYDIEEIRTIKNDRWVKDPLDPDEEPIFGVNYEKYKIDRQMIEEELEFSIEDEGIIVITDQGKFRILFDPRYFRSADIPILMSDISKIESIGYRPKYGLDDIISDMIHS